MTELKRTTTERRGTVWAAAGIAGVGIIALVLVAIFAAGQLATVAAIVVPVVAGAWALVQASYNHSRGLAKSGGADISLGKRGYPADVSGRKEGGE